MRGLKHADAIETRPSCAPWTGAAPVSTPAVEVLDDAIVRNDLADHWSRGAESFACETGRSMKAGQLVGPASKG